MALDHGMSSWERKRKLESLGLRYALLVEDRPKVGGAGRYRVGKTTPCLSSLSC